MADDNLIHSLTSKLARRNRQINAIIRIAAPDAVDLNDEQREIVIGGLQLMLIQLPEDQHPEVRAIIQSMRRRA